MRRVLIIVIVAAVVVTGCGPEAAKVVGGLLERGAARVATEKASVAIGASLSRITARSAVLAGRTDAVAVRSEAAAAAALEDSPALRQVAQESDAKVTAIAATTTRDTAARARVIACARGGALAGARSYAGSYLDDDAGREVENAVAAAVKSCLQRAFPSQATAVGYVADAVTNSVLVSSRQAGDAQATAQQYTDWLVYTAWLYGADGTITDTGTAVAAPSATALSVDDLLVVLYHARSGRLAVAAGNWPTAIANRRAVLGELGALRVAPALAGARQLLIGAMNASLLADRYHAACGACATPYDLAATNAKREFVRVFNPYLQARYGGTVDETVF